MRWPPCARHNGLHIDVWGQCVHVGAPVALRPGICTEDGCAEPIVSRIDLATGRVTRIEAGSDEPHRHLTPSRATVDVEALAEGIAKGMRRPRRRTDSDGPTDEPPGLPSIPRLLPRRPETGAPLGGIPRLT